MTLFSLTLVLFLIMDPMGKLKSFLSLIQGYTPARKRKIVLRELGFALIAMLFFNFVGDYLLTLLDIDDPAVYLASGVILFLIAIQILFPKPENGEAKKKNSEPYLVPIAIPMMAGPALLATIMLYAITTSHVLMVSSIFIAWIIVGIIFLLSDKIFNLIGTSGLLACEKLMGMVLVLMAIQRMLQGVLLFYTNASA